MLKIEGLKELERKLNTLTRKIEGLGGEHSVPLPELFPPEFMRANTRFSTIEEMLEAKGVKNAEEFKLLPDDEWDSFVTETTSLGSWEEMKGAGAKEWVSRRLDL